MILVVVVRGMSSLLYGRLDSNISEEAALNLSSIWIMLWSVRL